MATGAFRLTYPITPESQAALARFPEIGRTVRIPNAERSDLEIVRLLGNTHYTNVDRLLAFIEKELPGSGEIGARLVKQRDPFQFHACLAELFLFVHLRGRLGPSVRPSVFAKDAVGPEIEIAWQEFTVKIEVYSPLDLMAYQLITENLPMLLKYLEVDRGFMVEVSIEPVDDSVESVWYPYTLPVGKDAASSLNAWLNGVGASAQTFFAAATLHPGARLSLPGPGGTTVLSIEVREVFDDPETRCVVFTTGTRSTDARLLFECGTSEFTARSGSGEKLKTKMRGRQAGPPLPGVLRVLILNFAQADTAWPDFFIWSEIATRLDATLRLISNELTSGLPYDLVVPALLDIDCQFGVPIWLDASLSTRGGVFVGAARMAGQSRPRSRVEIDPTELEDLLGNEPTR